MMAQQQAEVHAFHSLLESHYQQVASEDSLKKVRAKAWELYNHVGLPTKKAEVFRYIPLRQLFAQTYHAAHPTLINLDTIAPYIYPECRQSVLVFVNGHFAPQLSNTQALPDRIEISSLQDAMGTYSSFLNNHWTKAMKEETDAFACANVALHRDGAFIYVTPKTIVDAPVQVLHVIDTQDKTMLMMPRLHVFVGAHAQLNLFSSSIQISGSGYCVNQVADLHLEEGARLHYSQLNNNLASEAWHLEALRAHLKRDSVLNTVSVTTGSNTIRQDYRVVLAGENSEAFLNGVCMLNDKRESHTNILIEHQAPHCRSNQLFKGVLNDFARSSFEGKIYVHQAAQKTEAFQLNKNLLLSDRAHADSKPNLEIFADDVKATHGATMGQLDSEQLFYMRARGIPDAEAKNLLIYGFCQEVLDKCILPSLHLNLSKQAKSYLS